jgi:hypothetical protein
MGCEHLVLGIYDYLQAQVKAEFDVPSDVRFLDGENTDPEQPSQDE